MEKTVTHSVQKDVDEHQFYCDECNEFLGASREYDDGYYETYGDFKQQICVQGQWYTMSKCLCKQCRAAKVNELVKLLEDFGFHKGFYAE